MPSRSDLQEVEDAWAVLEATGQPPVDQVVSRRSPWTYRGEPIGLARDGSGRRHLLIPIGEHDAFSPDRESAGVHMTDRMLLEDGRRRRFLDLVCQKEHLHDHFSVLITEVIEAVQAPGRPDHAIHGILERWRELLSRQGSTGPSLELLTGLFAELLVLREMADKAPAIAGSWTGPDGGRHDISTPAGSIEVKGTRLREGRRVEIHGAEQLEPPEDGELFLAYVRLERGPHGRSVLDLVEELEQIGCPSDPLRSGLMKLGLTSEHHEQVRETLFSLRERVTYKVASGFPCITRESFEGGKLPSGIASLTYVIDLTSEPPVPLSGTDWREQSKRLAASAT